MTVAQPSPPGATKDEIRQRAIDALVQAGLPFLVGGGYAFANYTPILRVPKDLDLFIVKRDLDRVLAALSKAGFETEVTFPHWLGKAYAGTEYIDVIFSSGNGLVRVDDSWFRHAPKGEVLGHQVHLIPPEEMIWSKAFVMERDRFDGADIAHTIRYCHDRIDWHRLLDRFGPDWRVLLAHVSLFGYIYPDCPDLIPAWMVDTLVERLRHDEPSAVAICRGTLLSRWQYRQDLEHYQDALLLPRSGLTPEEIERWTAPEDEPVPR